MSDSSSHSVGKHSAGSTSRSLLERLNRRDAHAWRELVELYSPLIVFWCQKKGLSAHDCEDILQDVFRTVVTNISRFRKERPADTFRGWLRVITHSRVMDHFRLTSTEANASGGSDAQRRLSQIVQPSNDIDTSSSNDTDEELDERAVIRDLYLRAIEVIRNNFEATTWRAFWRVTVDGCTVQEVAEELGLRPGTVRVAKSRVLKRLREQLGDSKE